jgi:hypothetical protein
MKCLSCLYLEVTYLNFCVKGNICCLFDVTLLSKSNINPRIRQQPPSEPKLINMKNALFKGFPPQRSMIMASSQTYQKLSLNSLDLVELEPKPVDHRQNRIYPLADRSAIHAFTIQGATSSRRVGFGKCSPSTTPTTPRTSPVPNPWGPLVSVSSRSGRIRKLLPQLHVCVFRLVTIVRIWCTRSLGRLNLLSRFPASPQRAGRWSPWTPEKKQMNNPFYYSLTRRSRAQVLPTCARNNDTWDRRRIVNNMRWSPTSSATCGPQTCVCRGSGPTVRIGRVLHTSLSRAQHANGGEFAG